METPNFEQIAREAARAMLAGGVVDVVSGVAKFAEQLRLVWNARGAADIAKVDATLYADGTSRTGFDEMLDRAIRSLDR